MQTKWCGMSGKFPRNVSMGSRQSMQSRVSRGNFYFFLFWVVKWKNGGWKIPNMTGLEWMAEFVRVIWVDQRTNYCLSSLYIVECMARHVWRGSGWPRSRRIGFGTRCSRTNRTKKTRQSAVNGTPICHDANVQILLSLASRQFELPSGQSTMFKCFGHSRICHLSRGRISWFRDGCKLSEVELVTDNSVFWCYSATAQCVVKKSWKKSCIFAPMTLIHWEAPRVHSTRMMRDARMLKALPLPTRRRPE